MVRTNGHRSHRAVFERPTPTGRPLLCMSGIVWAGEASEESHATSVLVKADCFKHWHAQKDTEDLEKPENLHQTENQRLNGTGYNPSRKTTCVVCSPCFGISFEGRANLTNLARTNPPTLQCSHEQYILERVWESSQGRSPETTERQQIRLTNSALSQLDRSRPKRPLLR